MIQIICKNCQSGPSYCNRPAQEMMIRIICKSCLTAPSYLLAAGQGDDNPDHLQKMLYRSSHAEPSSLQPAGWAEDNMDYLKTMSHWTLQQTCCTDDDIDHLHLRTFLFATGQLRRWCSESFAKIVNGTIPYTTDWLRRWLSGLNHLQRLSYQTILLATAKERLIQIVCRKLSHWTILVATGWLSKG